MNKTKTPLTAGISEQKRQFCTFSLEEKLFGVDILDVKEINSTAEFTPIFHAAEEIKGYVNIRGQIHLILDLRLLIGYKSREVEETGRLVLFKTDVGENFGVLVDRIGDVVTVDETMIEERSKGDYQSSDLEDTRLADISSGVCKLEGNLLVILDARKFLNEVGKKK